MTRVQVNAQSENRDIEHCVHDEKAKSSSIGRRTTFSKLPDTHPQQRTDGIGSLDSRWD
jgi:hypothetical protein